jgi:glutathione synthase/RimK-type ligase-like ATP-grasp enzyme
LPERLRLQCVALVRALGLQYGALDFILTPDGRYVFLELNPNGQWLWVERMTGLPIADAIAATLATLAEARA